jgi:hypothetical protein
MGCEAWIVGCGLRAVGCGRAWLSLYMSCYLERGCGCGCGWARVVGQRDGAGWKDGSARWSGAGDRKRHLWVSESRS